MRYCTIPECNNVEKKRGYCDKHYWTHIVKQAKPLYSTWRSMIRRCYDKSCNNYDRYGASGITVCDRWRRSYWDFHSDMGAKPSKTHSLDRIDPRLGYEPSNCRWANSDQQARNKYKYKKRELPVGIRFSSKHRDRYSVVLGGSKKRYYLGTYDTLRDAMEVRNRVKKVMGWDEL